MKMSRFGWCVALLLFAVAGNSAAQPKGADFAVAVKRIEAHFDPAEAKPGQTVTMRLDIELNDGWYTYASFQPDKAARRQRTEIVLPPLPGADILFVEPIKDPANYHVKAIPDLDIKELRYYPLGTTWEFKAVVSPKAEAGEKKVTLPRFKPLICVKRDKEESCLPPELVEVSATLKVLKAEPVEVESQFREAVNKALGIGSSEAPKVAPARNGEAAPTEEGPRSVGLRVQIARDYKADLNAVGEQIPALGSPGAPAAVGAGADSSSFVTFILTAMFWGGVTLLTPCVFPMIPITVSYFLKQGEKTHHSPLRMASLYTGTIIVVLGISAITLLSVFRALSVDPWMNIALGGLFVFFALSLFGMFDIVLPNFLVRFTSQREGQGGVAGTIFMAMSFTIVSFTCVAPFLGGFSGMAASGNFNTFQLALGGLAFATTFAAPFFFLALFPSMLRKLPKSGSWLNTVKVVMGFLELAAALKFFRTAELRWQIPPSLFSYDFVLAMWVALLVLMGLYLLNVYRLPHDEPQSHIGVPRMLFGFLSVSLAIYLMPAVFSSGSEKPRPGGVVYAWVDSFLLPDQGKEEFVWSGDLRAAIEDARMKKQLVFIDFTGVTCTNCKLNEKNVFPRPEVREQLKKYHLVQLYTDTVPGSLYDSVPMLARQEQDAKANLAFQLKQFGTQQLPLYVILKPDPGSTKVSIAGVYAEGKINDDTAFVEFLKAPLK